MIDRKDGKHFRFHIVFINSEAIGGKNRRILISDIANIEKITSHEKQINVGLTLGIIVGYFILGYVLCATTECVEISSL